MFTRIKAVLKDSIRKLGQNRLRSQLLMSSDRELEDMGFSRELLLQGISAWPWRVDNEQSVATLYSIFNTHEKEIQQAIRELKSFNDRDLADLGIARCDIESNVREGRAEDSQYLLERNSHNPQPKAA
jgi:uncharacterized protein YjiS (DUF1127 family)